MQQTKQTRQIKQLRHIKHIRQIKQVEQSNQNSTHKLWQTIYQNKYSYKQVKPVELQAQRKQTYYGTKHI